MKNFTNALKEKTTNPLLIGIILFSSLSSISCGSTTTDSLRKDEAKYLSFYETVDGETVHWEVNFFGNEITSIYKNGNKIPDDLVADYKDKVYDQLDEMRYGGKKYSFRMHFPAGEDFEFDMDHLHKDLEEMRKNLPEHKEHFEFYHFDNEEFEKQMEELKKELEENKLDFYRLEFDEKEFREQMEKLQKELKENLPNWKNFKFELKEEDTEV
jgi:chromosome segregation ATPase